MADATDRSDDPLRRLASRARSRLFEARWLLAAAIAAVLVLRGVDGSLAGSWGIAAVAIAVLVAVAALAPRYSSERRRSERDAAVAARGMERLTAADLAAAVSDPLVVFDRAGVVLHANQAARTAFGPIAAGSPVELRFRAPDMQDLLKRAMASSGGSLSIDYAEKVPLERWFRVSVTPVEAGEGVFVLVFRDQSETRRIDRMRADFIANASHELRTPLASVAGFIETLRGPARNDAAARENFLQIMQNQTARMARLIDDLLSLSRLEMKAYLKPGETVELVGVVGGVVDALAQLAAESGVVVERDLPTSPVEIAGSRDELIQVFENLIENACKYGQSGGRVVVSMQTSPDEVSVTVRDFGPGIPEEHIPRVTERFYRVDVGTSRAQKGTGLGLAIVKHILTRHNARLSIRSGEGKGAAFTAHFPPPAAKPAK